MLKPLEEFAGGADLEERPFSGACTHCHQGENAFIVHRHSMLDLGPQLLNALSWVRPIVPARWPQNKVPGKDLNRVHVPDDQKACTGCHSKPGHNRLPPLFLGNLYCKIVQDALKRTMPDAPRRDQDNKTTHALLGEDCQSRICDTQMGLTCDLGTLKCVSLTHAAHVEAIGALCSAANPAPKPPTRFAPPPTGSLFHGSFARSGEVPAVGDFNGDGRDDIVKFTMSPDFDAVIALSNGTRFSPSPGTKAHDFFGLPGEELRTGDVDGDGLDDIVVFTMGSARDVWVALSTGTAFEERSTFAHDSFGAPGDIVAVKDVNNDGKADLVRFTRGNNGPDGLVAVALSNGRTFGPARLFRSNFAMNGALPALGDVNGDGFADLVEFRRFDGDHRQDIVTFTNDSRADVHVALSRP